MNDSRIINILLIVVGILAVIAIIQKIVIKNDEDKKLEKKTSATKYDALTNNKKMMNRMGLIMLPIVILLLGIMFYLVCQTSYYGNYPSIDPEKLVFIFAIVGIGGIILIVIGVKVKETYTYQKLLSSKYKNVKLKLTNPKKYIEGNFFKLNSIRNNYNFTIKISKYNCQVLDYFVEKLERRVHYSEGRRHTSRVWTKQKRFIEYNYNLNDISVDLNNKTTKKKINKLEETREIFVEVKNKKLIVTKLIPDYLRKEQIIDNINDIEEIYQTLIK